MSNRYHPLGNSGSGRRFREQEESDVRSDLPMIRFTGKLTIRDERSKADSDPYNRVGTQYRAKPDKTTES